MVGREEVAAFLAALPETAHEIRIKAGPTKETVNGIASTSLEGGATVTAARVLEHVAKAELGEKVRLHVHDKNGKAIDTKYFSDGKEDSQANPLLSLHSDRPATAEDAIWRMALAFADSQRNTVGALLQLVTNIGIPIAALGTFFRNEGERREAAETKLIQLMGEHIELQGAASAALEALKAGGRPSGPSDEGGLKAATAAFLRDLVGGDSDKGAANGAKNRPS